MADAAAGTAATIAGPVSTISSTPARATRIGEECPAMVQVPSAGRTPGVAGKISEHVARRTARISTRTSPSTWRGWYRTGAQRPAHRATVGIGPRVHPYSAIIFIDRLEFAEVGC